MSDYIYKNGGTTPTLLHTSPRLRIEEIGGNAVNIDMYGGSNTYISYFDLNVEPTDTIVITMSIDFNCYGLENASTDNGYKITPYSESYDSVTGYYTKTIIAPKAYEGSPEPAWRSFKEIVVTKKTYTAGTDNIKYMDNIDNDNLFISYQTYKGWLNWDAYKTIARIPIATQWTGSAKSNLYLYTFNGELRNRTSDSSVMDYATITATDENSYYELTFTDDGVGITSSYTTNDTRWCVRFCDKSGQLATGDSTITVDDFQIVDSTTVRFKANNYHNHVVVCRAGGNTTSELTTKNFVLKKYEIPPIEWQSGIFHQYGDITTETITELTTKGTGSFYVKTTKVFELSNGYKGVYWCSVSPGDKIAFKFTNSTGRAVEYYTNSSQAFSTNRIYWGLADTIAKNKTFYPITDLHDEVINGETCKAFTVPTGMNYLVAGWVAGTSVDLATYFSATIYKKETTTTKGWTDN